eukprot:scaffold4410_cov32-Tisochrysis_lutea.AAC.3
MRMGVSQPAEEDPDDKAIALAKPSRSSEAAPYTLCLASLATPRLIGSSLLWSALRVFASPRCLWSSNVPSISRPELATSVR